MSKNIFIKSVTVLATAAMLLAIGGCNEKMPVWTPGQGGEDKPTVEPEKDADYSKLTKANHPRVIFTKSSEASIKEKLISGTDANVTKLHQIIISKADDALKKADLVYELKGKRLLDVSTAASNRIIPCAYAYRMTGEAKYLEKAERDINTVCAFKNWNASAHFLDTGEMAHAVGIGYDWLYNALSEETKRAAEKAIQNFAFDYALNKNPWFYTSVSNWNQVCNGGLVVAALATYESNSKNAKAIIDKAVSSNMPIMKEIYNPDGNYPEGYGYWCYGTTFECIMLAAMESCTGSDNGLGKCAEGFRQTGKWVMFMQGMNNEQFNYSDCAPNCTALPGLWYLADKFDDPSMLYVESRNLAGNMYTSYDSPKYYPFAIVYADKVPTTTITAPADHMWSGHGITPVGLVRGDWTFSDSDYLLGVKGGRCNYSHAHMDVGSFVYDAMGVRWSADFGLQSYGTVENYPYDTDKFPGGGFGSYEQTAFRWGVFRYNNYNHSTITINDALHNVKGSADIDDVINTKTSKGYRLDLSEMVSDQCDKAERTITMENDKDLVVKDMIKAKYNMQAKLRFTMVSKAQPTIDEAKNRVVLRSGNKVMYMTVTSEKGTPVTFKTWSTKGEAWDADNSGYYEVGYEAKVTSGKTETFTMKLSPNE